jgi:flagellin-like protein
MRKIFKSKKALSPVVAAIILIAVTVAVSIAVAAWMGALTFTFMKTEEVKITSISWGTGNANATLTAKNTGSSPLTVSLAKINGANAAAYRYRTLSGTWSSSSTTISLTMNAGDTYEICLTKAGTAPTTFTSGTKYEFAFQTAAGNTYPYTDTAP